MTILTETEAAYIAGFIDGEGSIGLFRQKGSSEGQLYYNIKIQITQTHLTPLKWILNKLQKGKIYKNYRTGNQADSYSLCLYMADCEEILPKILPYLVLKKRHAKLALKFIADWREKKPKKKSKTKEYIVPDYSLWERYKELFHKLNKRGREN